MIFEVIFQKWSGIQGLEPFAKADRSKEMVLFAVLRFLVGHSTAGRTYLYGTQPLTSRDETIYIGKAVLV
ncbi:MAG: hypothetical protein ACI9G1_000627 [Pirellulaceae bacterium]